MPTKVHILKDDFSSEIYSVGLVSSESVYQLILQINESIGISLKISDPIAIAVSPAINHIFATAVHDEEDELKIKLIKNKNEGHILFKNHSSMDFIIALTGKKGKLIVDKILQKTKSIKGVSMFSVLETKKLKNIQVYIS